MDKKSKFFFMFLGLLICGSIFFTYYRTVIAKDYLIEAQTDCDPYAQKCFVWHCDPESNVDGEKCTGEAEKDIWYYEIVKKKAFEIPLCDPNDSACNALECPENEPNCQIIFCNEETKAEQKVECSDPVEYTKENPVKDQTDMIDNANQGCAPDDTNCLNIE